MKYEVEKDFLKSAIILKETSNFENRARGNFSFFLCQLSITLIMLCTNCKISVAFYNKHNCSRDWKKMGVDWMAVLIMAWFPQMFQGQLAVYWSTPASAVTTTVTRLPSTGLSSSSRLV